MNITQTIKERLLAVTAISDVVGTNIFPVVVPQGKTNPSIVYNRITNSPNYIQSGNAIDALLLQFSFLGPDIDVAKTVMGLIRTSLERATFTADEGVVIDLIYNGLEAEDYFDDVTQWHIAETYLIKINKIE
jgi:hypothetical protein